MNRATVLSYIISLWVLWLIVFLIIGILFIVFSFVKRIKKYRSWAIVPLILITVYCLIPTVQGALDMSDQSYITEHVEYYRAQEADTRNSLVASDSVQITTADGAVIHLKGANSELPYGKYNGVVTYSKRSKIVIDFVADDAS